MKNLSFKSLFSYIPHLMYNDPFFLLISPTEKVYGLGDRG